MTAPLPTAEPVGPPPSEMTLQTPAFTETRPTPVPAGLFDSARYTAPSGPTANVSLRGIALDVPTVQRVAVFNESITRVRVPVDGSTLYTPSDVIAYQVLFGPTCTSF